MKTNTFADIIAENFEEIRNNFKKGLINKGYSFDEDLMNDAFISCNDTLKDKELTKTEAIKYYWTAYINKFKTAEANKKPIVSFDDIVEGYDTDIDEEIDIINEPYNEDIDKIYNYIIEKIQDHFGLKLWYIWELHVCYGKSPKQIECMGIVEDINYNSFCKKVKRFINKLIEEDDSLKELIKNRLEP